MDDGRIAAQRRIVAYSETMGGGHEHHFRNAIGPTVIKMHGWSDATIDFMLWVLIFNFYNSFERPTTVWRELGLAKAVSRHDPKAIAARLIDSLGADVETGQVSWSVLPHLRRCLGEGVTEWETVFFQEMERLAPGLIKN